MFSLLVSLSIFLAAVPATKAQDRKDKCEVVLIDLDEARKVADKGGDIEPLFKIVGEFDAEVGEERLTTRHFLVPGTKQYVTASVFYSDEEMTPVRKPDSQVWQDTTIRLGLFIGTQKPESAFGRENNAVALANYSDETLKVSAVKSVKLNGRLHSVSLECTCNGAVRRP